MLLSSLNLSQLPIEVLVSIKHAINDEIRSRKQRTFVQKRLAYLSSIKYSDWTFDEASKEIIKLNSESLLDLPVSTKKNSYHQ